MTVIKKNIVKNITESSNLSANDSLLLLESFLNLVIDNSKTKKIKITGFGSFAFKATPKRVGRNPKTNESYLIKAFKRFTFNPSIRIKKILN
ncbi:HU family DNA-binding protein [Gammaproteobacteria bacterium]|nr:HU family DNA-binding protein [Gammaproteobacteria bacterium]